MLYVIFYSLLPPEVWITGSEIVVGFRKLMTMTARSKACTVIYGGILGSWVDVCLRLLCAVFSCVGRGLATDQFPVSEMSRNNIPKPGKREAFGPNGLS
jgi:hypothetical protein